jgi:hypothetical protein
MEPFIEPSLAVELVLGGARKSEQLVGSRAPGGTYGGGYLVPGHPSIRPFRSHQTTPPPSPLALQLVHALGKRGADLWCVA